MRDKRVSFCSLGFRWGVLLNFWMKSLCEGFNSLPSLGYNPSSATGTNRPPHPLSAKHSRYEEASSTTGIDHGVKTSQTPTGLVNHSYKISHDQMRKEVLPDSSKHHFKSNQDNLEFVHSNKELDHTGESYSQKHVLILERKSSIKHSIDDSDNSDSSSLVKAGDLVSAAKGVEEIREREGERRRDKEERVEMI